MRTSSIVTAGILSLGLSACQTWKEASQGEKAAAGGVAGAVAGALIGGEDNRLLGALLGGALGAAGGYVIGASEEKVDEDARDEAIEASRQARTDPISSERARGKRTADLNDDGFVTLDEVVALEEAGLGDPEILERLRATDQVFELTPSQRDYLLEQGVSETVVGRIDSINRELRDEVINRERIDVR